MKDIVIYGIGKIGKDYINQCLECGIEGIRLTDSNCEVWKTKYRDIVIQSPEEAFRMEYDKVIVAVGEKYKKEVLNCLIHIYHVPNEKIVYCKETLLLKKNEIYNIGNMAFRERLMANRIVGWQEFYSMLQRENINDLEKFFFEGNHKAITKWLHYFEAYERFFSKYRNQDVVILEIGVYKGGSLQMWKNYFQGKGNRVMVYGIDINPECKELEEDNVEIYIGSQEDRGFLKKVKKKVGKVDILIDDGGHSMVQQITTVEELFDLVSEDGIYLCEDVHTSYMREIYGGEYKGNTFIEYTKNIIDCLHAQYSETDMLKANKYSEEIKSITYFDSMVFIEKKRRTTKSLSMQIENG